MQILLHLFYYFLFGLKIRWQCSPFGFRMQILFLLLSYFSLLVEMKMAVLPLRMQILFLLILSFFIMFYNWLKI
jgi:hypothetical protein